MQYWKTVTRSTLYMNYFCELGMIAMTIFKKYFGPLLLKGE